jgi:hypothetical protein
VGAGGGTGAAALGGTGAAALGGTSTTAVEGQVVTGPGSSVHGLSHRTDKVASAPDARAQSSHHDSRLGRLHSPFTTFLHLGSQLAQGWSQGRPSRKPVAWAPAGASGQAAAKSRARPTGGGQPLAAPCVLSLPLVRTGRVVQCRERPCRLLREAHPGWTRPLVPERGAPRQPSSRLLLRLGWERSNLEQTTAAGWLGVPC